MNAGILVPLALIILWAAWLHRRATRRPAPPQNRWERPPSLSVETAAQTAARRAYAAERWQGAPSEAPDPQRPTPDADRLLRALDDES